MALSWKLVVLFFSVFLVCSMCQDFSKQVQFYEDLNFKGLLWQGPPKSLYTCTNLPPKGQGRSSSLKTNVCIMAYTAPDCVDTIPTFSFQPGNYTDLSYIHHYRHFQNANKTIRSFRECQQDEGGDSPHIELALKSGVVLVEYWNVKECINLPNFCLGAVTTVRNHGSCVNLFDCVNCQCRGWTLLGGKSRESEDLSDINFDGKTKSIVPCTFQAQKDKYRLKLVGKKERNEV